MRIAILGWGSLLWDGGPEFDKWHGPWEYDGPSLKLEFTRVSEKRLKALTLVIDAEHGTETSVAWCLSKRAALAPAPSGNWNNVAVGVGTGFLVGGAIVVGILCPECFLVLAPAAAL